MMTFPIPVVAYRPDIGPGSQPLADEILNTLDMPADMHTFRPPLAELDAPPEVVQAAMAFLCELLAAMQNAAFVAPVPVRFSLRALEPAVRKEVNQLLGEGEISVITGCDLRAQETAFTGIWRVQGDAVDDVEVSSFPTVLRELMMARPDPGTIDIGSTDDLMNGPALFHEISTLSSQWDSGRSAHVVNLSLLPVTPDDLIWLDAKLGRASFSVLSRGFGNCRITAAAYPYVWWVQYFNSTEKLILNSIEIVDIPSVALAAVQDYEESIIRLDEWIASLQSAL